MSDSAFESQTYSFSINWSIPSYPSIENKIIFKSFISKQHILAIVVTEVMMN